MKFHVVFKYSIRTHYVFDNKFSSDAGEYNATITGKREIIEATVSITVNNIDYSQQYAGEYFKKFKECPTILPEKNETETFRVSETEQSFNVEATDVTSAIEIAYDDFDIDDVGDDW